MQDSAVHMELNMSGILIIGYGNLLRGDDAAGIVAARELEKYFRDDDDVEVIAAQELMPEMVELVSRSNFVLFLDASSDENPGSISCLPLEAEDDTCRLTHHLSPAVLLKAAQEIYGETPTAVSLTLAGWSFNLNHELSSQACERLPELIRQAKEIVASYRWLANATCLPVG
jgi:hydrogenase maturation protease